MDRNAASIAPPRQPPAPPPAHQVVVSGAIGLGILMAVAMAGGTVQKSLHLSLPGPVIGLALLAVVCLLAGRFHTPSHRQLARHVAPVSRLLVSHLGLLFVPAGVGIITEGDTLRREWLPVVAALLGSTLLGLVATGWMMQRFSSERTGPKS